MKSFEDLRVKDYLSMLRRRIRYLLVSVLLTSSATGFWLWRTPSIYQSETTIFAQGQFIPEDYLGSLVRQTVDQRIEFVRQQLQSRKFLEPIVKEFNPNADNAQIESQVIAVRSNQEFTAISESTFKLGYRSADPLLAQTMTKRLADAIIKLNDSRRKEKVHVADVFLVQQYTQAASGLASAEQKLYQFRTQNRVASSQESAAPEALRGLQNQVSVLDDRLAGLSDRRKALERRLSEQEQLRRIDPTPAAAPEPAALASSPEEDRLANARSELALARRRYTADHPEVARLAREVGDLEASVRQAASRPRPAPNETRVTALPEPGFSIEILHNEIQGEFDQLDREVAKTQQARKEVLGKIALLEATLNPSSSVAQQLGLLTREYDSAKQLHSFLEGKKQVSELASRVDLSDENRVFTIIDVANLPRGPIWPNRPLYGTVGLFAGVFLGLGLVFVRESLDPTLHEEEAAAELKLPVLTCIPKVRGKKVKKRCSSVGSLSIVPSPDYWAPGNVFHLQSADPLVKDVVLDTATIAGEQFRMMRAKLSLMQNNRAPQSLLVTSALPNEGKSFVACCLAGTLARGLRRKVLLIDLDLRKGGAAKLLGLDPESRGVSALLRRTATTTDFEQSLWKCADVNLYVLPPGAAVEDPGESLDSPELERIVREAKLRFDWVIIDSPPGLVLADANIIAPKCDSTLFVVDTGGTPINFVKDAIQKIGQNRVCGIVMNRDRTMKSNRHHVYYYYRSSQTRYS
jgi:polysaccharide chain length determinant protein (PEP-CTERM system associated)